MLIKKQKADFNDSKVPNKEFVGEISINLNELIVPLNMNFLKNRDDVKIVKDTDSLKYGLNIYFAYLEDKKYTLWVDKNDEEITSLYF